jgi:hypothetical protein
MSQEESEQGGAPTSWGLQRGRDLLEHKKKVTTTQSSNSCNETIEHFPRNPIDMTHMIWSGNSHNKITWDTCTHGNITQTTKQNKTKQQLSLGNGCNDRDTLACAAMQHNTNNKQQ